MNKKVACLISILCLLYFPLKATFAEQGHLIGGSLVSALQQGGYILYFRHAATDWSQYDNVENKGDWWSCDPSKMRQLSEKGRVVSRKIGEAIRNLSIPIGSIYASEYCRTRDTAKHFGLGMVIPSNEIMNMRAASYFGGRDLVIKRAQKALRGRPASGTNTIWVSHGNILRAATGEYPGEAGCIVFKPKKNGTLHVVSRINPEDWIALEQQYSENIE